MGHLTNRHKKPGGFRKLVNSLETTPKSRREKIINMMREEDPDFIAEVEKCIFTFDEFETTSDLILCEFLEFFKEPRVLAIAFYKHPNEKLVEKFEKCMSPTQRFEFKEFMNGMRGVTVREQDAARYRLIEKARELEKPKSYCLKKYSAAYPDD